jgi:hypothetical protein
MKNEVLLVFPILMVVVRAIQCIVSGVASGNKSIVNRADKRIQASFTGTLSRGNVGCLNIADGQAIEIMPDVKKGSLFVSIYNDGRAVFCDDVGQYDDCLYVTNVLGRCDVGINTTDVDGSVDLLVCNVADVADKSLLWQVGSSPLCQVAE